MSAARTTAVAAAIGMVSRAEWLASWVQGNRGLCRICNAAQPSAEPLHCPTGCALEPAYQTGSRTARAFDIIKRKEKKPPAPADETPSRPRAVPRVYSLRELADNPAMTTRPPMLVPNLVMQRGVTLLSGQHKSGKSTLCSQIAADFSAGRPTFDGSRLAPGRVLWIGVDEPSYMLVPRLVTMGADVDNVIVMLRDPEAPLTPTSFADALTTHRPRLVILDTLSQLAINSGVKLNEAESVGVFMRALVDAVQAQPLCGALFTFHTPHHSARAFGSVQWQAIVDAPLTFRRRAPRIARPGESPDDDAEQSGPEDGRRVLEGVTRWGGSQRLLLSFSGGRYSLGDAEPDLIQRVRWHLRDTEAGVGRTSRAAIAKKLGVRDSAVGDVVRQLIERKEVADATEAGKSYLKATASMAIYAGRGPEAHGGAGEEEREEVYATGSECSSRFETPACTDGKSTLPIEDDGYFDALLADEASVGVEEQFG